MEYSDITTQLTTYWTVATIQLPTFFDKDLIYTMMYPHRLYIKTYGEMPMVPITQSNNGGYVRRNQIAEIHGVYASYSDCKKALIETKNSIAKHTGWLIQGKSEIIEKKGIFIFILRWLEKSYIQSGSW